jgi:site-specific DNA-methyltransferase (adenine-specific)
VRLLRGRLKFGGSRNSAPFPSAVIVFRPWRVK